MHINQQRGEINEVTGVHGPVIDNDALDVDHVYCHGVVKRFLVQSLGLVVDIEIGLDGFIVIIVETDSLLQEVSLYIGSVFTQIKFHLGILLNIP